MKQVLLGKRITVADVPAPGLGAGEVLVEVAYSFISTGTEVAGVKAAGAGLLAKVREHPDRIRQVLEMVRVNGVRKTLARIRSRLEAASPLGYSAAGRVVAVGARVTGIAVGDLVACAGQGYASHAEVTAVPANLVAKVPPGCDLRSASGATVASIALQGVRRADLRLGETAAVLGLGLLGQIVLQLLAASGVKAIGFDLNPQRVEEAKALGFPDCFAVVGDEAAREVVARTAGMGADATVITAATSAPGVCQNAIEMTRAKGRVVVVGAVPLEFDRQPFYRKEIDFTISCSYGPGRYDRSYEEGGHDYPYPYVRWTENRNMQAVLRLMAEGALRLAPLVVAEYPIARAEEAFGRLSTEGGPRPLAVVLQYDLAEAASPAKSLSGHCGTAALGGAERQPDIRTAEGGGATGLSGIGAKASRNIRMAAPAPHAGKIAVGLVGVGQFCAGTHLPNLAVLADRYQIVGVCDKQGARAQDVARQCGAAQACSEASDLFANPDVTLVLISTRHDLHAPLAMAALAAGKHVFTEKPMAMDEGQLQDLVAAIGAAGRCFMVGFNRRFSPHVVQLRRLLGRRTTPLVVNYRVLADTAPLDSWIYTPSGGGRVIGEACHMLDLFNFLVGDEVPEVELDVAAPPANKAGPAGDNFVATVRYEDGSVCTLTYSTLGRKSKEIGKERLEALWDGKAFVIDDFARSFGSGCSAGSAAARGSKGHLEELAALADHLQGKGPPPISAEACARATEMSFRVDAVCRG